ncbi:MAG: hypothetical protein HY646_07945 [Acidobacteria bacterium]|nr:hypothetical protein [Acidobacteriota bacterium]
MSDRDIIIRSLERVERRIRANKLFRELTVGLSLFLLLPVLLKLWDLVSPFRARTITIIIGIWLAAFAGYIAWRFRGKGSLSHAAASIDHTASLHDALKTAYWFINHPRSSEWIDAQIRRAAREAERLNLDQLYPRDIPRTSYIATAMILLFVALNFVPLPWNYNWLQLQAAPAFMLTDREQALVEQAKELIAQAEQMQQSELAERLEELVRQLQEGEISPSEALKQLQEIQNELEEGNLDMGSIVDGIEEMAKDLQQSEKMTDVAQAMLDKQLKEAADELRDLAKELAKQNPEDLKEMQESLQQASENTRAGLDELAKDLKQASQDLKQQNTKEAQQSLQKAAQDMEKLADKLSSQQLKNQASQQLQDFEESLRQRQQQQAQQGEQQQGKQGQQQQQSEGQEGEGQQSEMGESAQAMAGQQGQQGQQAPKPGAPGQGEQQNQAGTGMMPSGTGNPPLPFEGAATKLEVQLQQEKLTGMHDEGTKQEELEEASKQERSRLDYRNIKSELSPAQKDLLNQDRIPWEYRPLIKNYFQAIRPPLKK